MVFSNRLRGALGVLIWIMSAPANAQTLEPIAPAKETSPALSRASGTPSQGQRPIHRAASQAAIDSAALTQWQPRHGSRPNCSKKLLLGLGIGAGIGIGYGALAWRGVDEPGKFMAASTTLFGLIGLAVGLNLCR